MLNRLLLLATPPTMRGLRRLLNWLAARSLAIEGVINIEVGGYLEEDG